MQQQKAMAKAQHAKAQQYAVLVREMFAPSVDELKRKEVQGRQAITKSQRARAPLPQSVVEAQQGEPKAIPPEARGKIRPKNSTNTSTTTAQDKRKLPGSHASHQPSGDKDTALQFGNIRLVKSTKQVAEDREATVAQWQTRAKAILNTLSQKEAQLIADVLAPLHLRFAKHAMVSSMYCDTISAKLDLLSELCTM